MYQKSEIERIQLSEFSRFKGSGAERNQDHSIWKVNILIDIPEFQSNRIEFQFFNKYVQKLE